ncbi:hypothetical protein [Microbulbifer sp. GL-2]|uniref:hypothetical protein n=1 Tax=Microbulbifer sp. GL-2 TaxID=2591606 RepID=UPI00116426C2|nr:hypothetical protein [Microbulbifer sp. GL-2]BBM03568.1 hypothetical protein GL2_36420 [Microbulbifer sp. GL-2]
MQAFAQKGGFTDGFKQYFSDQAKFLSHLDDLSGANGPEAQAREEVSHGILMAGVRAVSLDLQVTYNGKVVSARDMALKQVGQMIQNNPSYFAGRFTASLGTSGTLSLPFYTSGPGGLISTFVLGMSLQTTATLGGGIRAIESGVNNPIDVISQGFYGAN